MCRLFHGRRLLLFDALVLIAAQPVLDQLGSATISGAVADSTGAAVAAATVTAINVANNFRRVTTSNAVGQYSLPGLTPGAYNLIVELQGFKKFEVQGQAPLVETASASMGAVIDTQKDMERLSRFV